jgi:hypothetical protein
MPEKIVKYKITNSNLVNCHCIDISILPDGRIDIKNAAKLIGVKPKSLSVILHRAGMPPHVKILGKIYFYYDDIVKWLKAYEKKKK